MTAKETTENQYYAGTGRRKTAVATVRIIPNSKVIEINSVKAELNQLLSAPFELVGQKDGFGMTAHVLGGGKVSQMDAIRLGIARALEKFNPDFRTVLKKAGFLTRDPREKERKKPGLKRARRAPQWAKR